MNSKQVSQKHKTFFLLPFLCGLLVFLTGCVRYDVGITFPHQHQGEIVQHITLGQRLTTLSQTEATKWLNSIEQRANRLEGKTKRLSDREIVVTIPFGNGQELVEKFNRFFDPSSSFKVNQSNPESLQLLQLDSKLAIVQNNWFFWERNQLTLTVDLRALGILSNQGNVIVSPGSLVDIDFVLNTPLGGRSLMEETGLNPEVTKNGNQLIWHLQPGEINTIGTVFWVPSYLAIGTVAIILLAILGFYLKYKHFPGLPQPS